MTTYTRVLTDNEIRQLSRISFADTVVLNYDGWISQAPTAERGYQPQERGVVQGYWQHWNDEGYPVRSILTESLYLFGLVYQAGVHKASHVYRITEAGRAALAEHRPRRYGCMCEHSVRTGCVCSESTYCPNPEHTGNGCHGTHD